MTTNDDKLDLTPRGQWRLFRKGCNTTCPRCQALFRFTVAGPFILMASSVLIAPFIGYHFRPDWRGALGGHLAGLAITHLFSTYFHPIVFKHIDRCARLRTERALRELAARRRKDDG